MTEPNARPAPSAMGTLAQTPVVHLLLYPYEKKLTGSIELVAPDGGTSAIRFLQGRPSRVRTSDPVAYLGQVMAEMGYLTQEDLNRTLGDLARQKTTERKLHGVLLREQQLVTEEQLDAALREQIARKLRWLATLPAETTYAYYDGYDSLDGWGADVGQGIDVPPLLWGIIREAPPLNHVNAALARVGNTMALRLVRGADPSALGLAGPDERRALDLLRKRPIRIEMLAAVSTMSPFDAQLLSYLLLMTKQVEVVRAGDTPLPTAQQHAVAEALRSARISPAGGVMPPASVRSPPSKPSLVDSPPAAPPSVRRPQITLRGATPPSPGLSSELQARYNDIVERAQTIDQTDYFAMLGIPREATADDVERAFWTLAKRWHPDRLPQDLAGVREACSRVFARMSEARTTLVDDEQRRKYMGLLHDGSGTPEAQETVQKVLAAAMNFQKAEVFLKRSDLIAAEEHCRQAHQDDPTQPDYLAMLAWITSLKASHQSPEGAMECVRMLDRALQMNERCEKAAFWRGLLYKRLGKADLAHKDFRLAVELNPRNIDAAREVRLFTMRSKPDLGVEAPASSRGNTLLGRLFKK